MEEETEVHVVSPHVVVSPLEDNWHSGLQLAHFLLCVRKFQLHELHGCVRSSREGRAKN